LKINGNKITNDQEIADKFNNYYLNNPQELCKKLPSQSEDPCLYMKHKIKESLYLNPVTEEEILKILGNLKSSSPGYDEISAEVVKSVKKTIVIPLTYLCNLSLITGKVPHSLKIAKVTPIYKKGSKDIIANYRPVSVLPVFSKIYERLVYNRIMKFIEKHNILHKHQFGFRKNHSTCLAINTLIDQFHNSIENGDFMLGLFMDLTHAFDTISYDILFSKLHHYGIRGIALEWIRDYLNNRIQFVRINQSNSFTGRLEIGIPQGSILGPLLFLLYVNDLSNISSKHSYIQFADDTSIFVSGKSLHNICDNMNSELSKIHRWMVSNKLTLNISKTKYMVMCSPGKKVDPQNCNITVNNSILERVKNIKFLGVVLDQNCTWKDHIDYIAKKISKCLGILTKARKVLTTTSLVTLYNSIIKPYFTYCIIIWGNTCKTYIKPLEILHKKILRIITFSDYNTHTRPLYEQLKIMNMKETHVYFSSLHIYKCINHLSPCMFWHYFVKSPSLRNSFNLQNIFYSKKLCKSSIRFYGPEIWNKLPLHIKMSKTLNTFKNKMKTFLLTNNTEH